MSVNVYDGSSLEKVAGSFLTDSSLNVNSTNAISNSAVTTAVNQINSDLSDKASKGWTYFSDAVGTVQQNISALSTCNEIKITAVYSTGSALVKLTTILSRDDIFASSSDNNQFFMGASYGGAGVGCCVYAYRDSKIMGVYDFYFNGSIDPQYVGLFIHYR